MGDIILRSRASQDISGKLLAGDHDDQTQDLIDLNSAKANKDDVATALSGKANSVHGHPISDISGLQQKLDSQDAIIAVTARLDNSNKVIQTANQADKLATSRVIALSGDVTGSVNFDGSSNVNIAVTVVDDSHNHNSTTIPDFTEAVQDVVGGMVSANTENGIGVSYDDNSGKLNFDVNDFSITLTGHVTGSGTVTNLANVSISTVVGDDSHTHQFSNITSKPTTLSGYGITDAVNISDVVTVATANKILKLDSNGSLPTSITGNAVSANKLSTNRSITLQGGVTGSVNFDGSANVFLTAQVANDSHTHQFDNLTNKPTTLAGYGITDAYAKSGGTISGDVIVTGNLTVQGGTTTVNSSTITVEDPVITVGGNPSSNDGKDRGVEFVWHNGTSQKKGFFGYDNSTGKFTFIPDSSGSSTAVYAGAKGTLDAFVSFSDITGKPTTLSGYGITDAVNVSEIVTSATANKVLRLNVNSQLPASITGSAATAVRLETTRSIALSGDTTGSVNFDGTANVTLSSTLSNSGVTSGTYGSSTYVPIITVDAKGRLTSVTSQQISSSGSLGYTPANQAGDTFTGNVTVPNLFTTGISYKGSSNESSERVFTITTASTTLQVAGSIPSGDCRGLEVLVSSSQGTSYTVTKYILIHDGTSVLMSETNSLSFGSFLGSMDADISGGNLRFLVTPTSSSSTKFTLLVTLIKV